MKHGIIDLFAGVGGVANGFREQGDFDVIALADIDPNCRKAYLENFPGVTYLKEDVRTLSARSFLDAADGRQIEGIVGCPPCQGFSSAGLRDSAHPMNRLVDDYFRLVRELNPKFLVMENVPNILYSDRFKSLTWAIEEFGYKLWIGVLNAALYGVPQTRQRAIVLGYREDLGVAPKPPAPTHFGARPIYDYSQMRMIDLNENTCAQALGAYPSVEILRRKGLGHVPWLELTQEEVARLRRLPNIVTVEEALDDLPKPVGRGEDPAVNGHVAWKHTEAMLQRLENVKPGGRLMTTKLAENGVHVERYFSQAYARLHAKGLGYTISTYFHNPGSGRYLHYRDTRCLTVREAARLQTISDREGVKDGFIFPGNASTSERLVGNAFPTLMAKALAQSVADALPVGV